MKGHFNSTEWQTLEFAPLWVHTMVAMGDGRIDEKESEVLTKEINESFFWRKGLSLEVLEAMRDRLASVLEEFHADMRNPEEGLSEVAAILKEKMQPEVSRDFKKDLFLLATKTAKASGGWAVNRWTGDSISQTEQKILDEISAALCIPCDELRGNA